MKTKKTVSKGKIVVLIAVLALGLALLLPRLWARHKAKEYLEETYGDAIVLKDVKFGKIWTDIFSGHYSVAAEYDGVSFSVYSGKDTYVEYYQQKHYSDLLLSGGMDELIGYVSVTIMDRQSGAAMLDKTDVKFQLTLNFAKTFSTKEEYAAVVRQVLDRLEESKLTACDLLVTYGYVNDRLMECSVSPMWDAPTDAEILAAVTVSLLGT